MQHESVFQMMARNGDFQRFLQRSLSEDMQLEIQMPVKFSGHLNQIQWPLPFRQSTNEPQLPRRGLGGAAATPSKEASCGAPLLITCRCVASSRGNC